MQKQPTLLTVVHNYTMCFPIPVVDDGFDVFRFLLFLEVLEVFEVIDSSPLTEPALNEKRNFSF